MMIKIKTMQYIALLENQSFEGWSQDAIDGYLTACKSIKEFLKKNINFF